MKADGEMGSEDGPTGQCMKSKHGEFEYCDLWFGTGCLDTLVRLLNQLHKQNEKKRHELLALSIKRPESRQTG